MNNEKRETAERKCYRIIKDRIRTGELAEGTRLVESVLSKELKLSRTPIRKAIGMLAADGYVIYEDYRGATVKSCILNKEDYLEIIEVIFLFSKEAVEKICDKHILIDSLSWQLDVPETRKKYQEFGIEGLNYQHTFIYILLAATSNSYYNLIVQDLFSKLQAFSDRDVRNLMDQSLDEWIKQINDLFQTLETRNKHAAIAILEAMLNDQILRAFR